MAPRGAYARLPQALQPVSEGSSPCWILPRPHWPWEGVPFLTFSLGVFGFWGFLAAFGGLGLLGLGEEARIA